MITEKQILNQSKKVAELRRKVVQAQNETKFIKRQLDRHEFELLSANPPQGSNDTQRKLDRTRILHTADSWVALDEKVFRCEVAQSEIEADLESEKDILQGMEWAVRCAIVRESNQVVTSADSYIANIQVDAPPPPPPAWESYFEEGGH